MRLWHFDLVPYLPKLQMLSQYRELVAIIKRIDKQGTPNHILVNKVMNYNWTDFEYYSELVVRCLKEKGYKINENCCVKIVIIIFIKYNYLYNIGDKNYGFTNFCL